MTLHPITCRACRQPAHLIFTITRVATYFGDHHHGPNDMAREDGTYEPSSRTFLCDSCYITRGCPLKRGPRWY